jgi:hypothetical protein
MKDQISITISSSKKVDVAFASIGLKVGSRTGPHKRTKDDMEWYVVRRFLRETISTGIFVPPISVRKGYLPDPDFVVVGADAKEPIALIEITEATDKNDGIRTQGAADVARYFLWKVLWRSSKSKMGMGEGRYRCD